LSSRVDPAAIELVVRYLDQLDEDAYSEALADNIMDPPEGAPYDEETQAFRTAALIDRTYAAAVYLLDHVNVILGHAERDERYKAVRRKAFRAKVERELRILRPIKDAEDARRHVEARRPNPRRRAERRLVQLNLKGDVPKGMFNQLLAEEEEKEREARREQKRLARERRRLAQQRERELAQQDGNLQDSFYSAT